MNTAKRDAEKYVKEWRKRKRGCMDIIDTICESAECNRREFIVRILYRLTIIRKSWVLTRMRISMWT